MKQVFEASFCYKSESCVISTSNIQSILPIIQSHFQLISPREIIVGFVDPSNRFILSSEFFTNLWNYHREKLIVCTRDTSCPLNASQSQDKSRIYIQSVRVESSPHRRMGRACSLSSNLLFFDLCNEIKDLSEFLGRSRKVKLAMVFVITSGSKLKFGVNPSHLKDLSKNSYHYILTNDVPNYVKPFNNDLSLSLSSSENCFNESKISTIIVKQGMIFDIIPIEPHVDAVIDLLTELCPNNSSEISKSAILMSKSANSSRSQTQNPILLVLKDLLDESMKDFRTKITEMVQLRIFLDSRNEILQEIDRSIPIKTKDKKFLNAVLEKLSQIKIRENELNIKEMMIVVNALHNSSIIDTNKAMDFRSRLFSLEKLLSKSSIVSEKKEIISKNQNDFLKVQKIFADFLNKKISLVSFIDSISALLDDICEIETKAQNSNEILENLLEKQMEENFPEIETMNNSIVLPISQISNHLSFNLNNHENTIHIKDQNVSDRCLTNTSNPYIASINNKIIERRFGELSTVLNSSSQETVVKDTELLLKMKKTTSHQNEGTKIRTKNHISGSPIYRKQKTDESQNGSNVKNQNLDILGSQPFLPVSEEKPWNKFPNARKLIDNTIIMPDSCVDYIQNDLIKTIPLDLKNDGSFKEEVDNDRKNYVDEASNDIKHFLSSNPKIPVDLPEISIKEIQFSQTEINKNFSCENNLMTLHQSQMSPLPIKHSWLFESQKNITASVCSKKVNFNSETAICTSQLFLLSNRELVSLANSKLQSSLSDAFIPIFNNFQRYFVSWTEKVLPKVENLERDIDFEDKILKLAENDEFCKNLVIFEFSPNEKEKSEASLLLSSLIIGETDRNYSDSSDVSEKARRLFLCFLFAIFDQLHRARLINSNQCIFWKNYSLLKDDKLLIHSASKTFISDSLEKFCDFLFSYEKEVTIKDISQTDEDLYEMKGDIFESKFPRVLLYLTQSQRLEILSLFRAQSPEFLSVLYSFQGTPRELSKELLKFSCLRDLKNNFSLRKAEVGWKTILLEMLESLHSMFASRMMGFNEFFQDLSNTSKFDRSEVLQGMLASFEFNQDKGDFIENMRLFLGNLFWQSHQTLLEEALKGQKVNKDRLLRAKNALSDKKNPSHNYMTSLLQLLYAVRDFDDFVESLEVI